MANEWYYVRDGRQFGPCTSEELKQLAACGSLTPGDLVQEAGMAEWVPVGNVAELLPAESLCTASDANAPQAASDGLPGLPVSGDPTDGEASSDAPFEFAREYANVVSKARRRKLFFDDALRVSLILAMIGVVNAGFFGLSALRCYGTLQTLERVKNTPNIAHRGPSAEAVRQSLLASLGGATVGVVFVAFAFWARYDPLPPAVIGFVIYVAAVLVNTVVVDVSTRVGMFRAGSSLLIRLLFIALFLDAIRAALAWRRMQSRDRSRASEARNTERIGHAANIA